MAAGRPYGRLRNFQGMGITPQWFFWKGPEAGIPYDHWAGNYDTQARAEHACRTHGLTPSYASKPETLAANLERQKQLITIPIKRR